MIWHGKTVGQPDSMCSLFLYQDCNDDATALSCRIVRACDILIPLALQASNAYTLPNVGKMTLPPPKPAPTKNVTQNRSQVPFRPNLADEPGRDFGTEPGHMSRPGTAAAQIISCLRFLRPATV